MALLLFVSSLSIGVEYSEHFVTPHTTPAITTIHVVSSNHFDGGCKIRGCNTASSPDWVDPMWHANGTACAMTMHGPGQPHAYHVVNRAFSNWFPLAAKLGDRRMFQHLMRCAAVVEWRWGPVTSYMLDLALVDSCGTSGTDVMELIGRLDASHATREMLLEHFMQGFMHDLFLEKWERCAPPALERPWLH